MTRVAALLQPADPQQRPHIGALLRAAGLPTADLRPDHPADFTTLCPTGSTCMTRNLQTPSPP